MLARVLVFSCLAGWAATAAGYDYPITDPWLATVVGTPEPLRADLPDTKLRVRRLPRDDRREMPEALWDDQRLEYSFRMQSGSAPLIFVIAGTGGYHNTGKNLPLLRAFYQAGFHVVGITSPTHIEFVTAASGTGVPGHMAQDAADIYRVMQRISERIGRKDRITGYHLTGYSLGGTNAAFVAKLDAEQQVFGFEKVLLINPAVSLYNSISKLDRMLQNVPGGLDNFNLFFSEVVQQITAAYQRSTITEFGPDLVYDAFKANPPTDEELAALIGVAFRLASSGMIMASDMQTDFGFIKPSNMTFGRNASLGRFGQMAVRVGFTDYYHEYFWPFFQDDYPGESRYSFAQLHTLQAIRLYLEQAQHVGVLHNENDIILSAGEFEFLEELFGQGERSIFFPTGGHLGNLEHRDVMAAVVMYFQ